MNRKQFFKASALGVIPLVLGDFRFLEAYQDYPAIKPVKNQKFAKIVSCQDSSCVSEDYSINAQHVRGLFRSSLLQFTGKNTIVEAVRSLFPEFRPDLRVAIKINTASWYMPSHMILAEAIAACLVEAGLVPDNVIIWERAESTLKGAGYPIRNEAGKVKIIATDTPSYGYDESKSYKINGVSVVLTSIITRHSDYLINLGVMKNHFFAGVTTAMKNLYGTIPLLDRPFYLGPIGLFKFHSNCCDPYISEVNILVGQKTPTILYVCDALFGIYNNGPYGTPQWIQNEVMLSNDPVALDTLSLYRIEEKRKDVGLPPTIGRAKFIKTSAHLGIGTNNPENMDIITKIIG